MLHVFYPIALAGLFFASLPLLRAQPYIDGGPTRHRFAQLNLGTDNRVFLPTQPGNTTPGELERRTLGPHGESRFLLGGTHFWGHADFYLAVPLATFNREGYSTGAESVFQFFPWKIRDRKLRPYLGFSWLSAHYRQGEGPTMKRSRFPLLAGVLYNFDHQLFELGLGYNAAHTFRYYTSPTVESKIQTPPLWLSFGYKWMFETTINAEKNWRTGRTRVLTDSLAARHRLRGLTLAIGPSEALFVRKSPHNEAVAPYIDRHVASKAFLDVNIGYYLYRPDLQLNLVWRGYRNSIGAYGYSQKVQRRALSFEAIKFLADYHGFAVFAGPVLSYEQLRVTDTDANGGRIEGRFEGMKPGLTFGWDIRPDYLQTYYLRTTLRYFPKLPVAMPGGRRFFFDTLELNFIQLVVFPGRIGKGYGKMR
ncbi:MAG: hypothetical protein IT260_11865 [Saprospiraceae bacterium]|nr:hypothetical protein [Saprospiraceae bacterium]